MFISEGQALIIIGVEFLAGALLGLIVAGLILRSRLRPGRAAITCALCGFTFLCFVGLGGWLSFPRASLGNHLTLANFFIEHAYMLAILGSCLVATGISIAELRRNKMPYPLG